MVYRNFTTLTGVEMTQVPKKTIFETIVENMRARDLAILSEYACSNSDAIRRKPEEVGLRPAFFRDTDRIIHSTAYVRYADKTQVFSLFRNDHITHRFLHVQFVAKIGRVVGRALRLNEDLIEAIALGHDLGHSPFGHDGERVLDRICQEEKIGFFAHNAQSVRFLSEIEKMDNPLNLTLQVLDGILCHNGEIFDRRYEPSSKKGWEDFDREYRQCFTVAEWSKKIFPMTLEGCVTRVVDIIAYIGRDIEDAITVNLIQRNDLPKDVVKVLGKTNDAIINTLVTDLIEHSYEKPYLELSSPVFCALQELRRFNYSNIYFNPRIKTESGKIEHIFRALFQGYVDDIQKEKKSSPVVRYFAHYAKIDSLRKTDPRRVVIDFIAGMTDDYLIDQYMERITPCSYGYSLEG
jgi:dGTPase